MGQDNYMQVWELNGYSSEEEYSKQEVNNESYFYYLASKANSKDLAIDISIESEKIDNVKEIKF